MKHRSGTRSVSSPLRSLALAAVLMGALVVVFGCGQPVTPPPATPSSGGSSSGAPGDAAPACRVDSDCAVGRVCREGSCALMPCTKEYAPVCGVDGRTYANACMARAAHAVVESVGRCQDVCGGFRGLTCPEGSLCDLPWGRCQASDLEGDCVLVSSDGCPEIFRPVCGCNGETYANDCERLVAQVQKDYDGRCRTGTDG